MSHMHASISADLSMQYNMTSEALCNKYKLGLSAYRSCAYGGLHYNWLGTSVGVL